MDSLFVNAPRIAHVSCLARLSSRRYATHLATSPPVAIARRTFSFSSTLGTGSSLPYKRYVMQDFKANKVRRSPPDGSRSKHVAYIALGSNLGDRIALIERACREMDSRGIRVRRTSCLWETEPMYLLDQDRFVNGACEVCCFRPVSSARVLFCFISFAVAKETDRSRRSWGLLSFSTSSRV
jgi:hypothetical protein